MTEISTFLNSLLGSFRHFPPASLQQYYLFVIESYFFRVQEVIRINSELLQAALCWSRKHNSEPVAATFGEQVLILSVNLHRLTGSQLPLQRFCPRFQHRRTPVWRKTISAAEDSSLFAGRPFRKSLICRAICVGVNCFYAGNFDTRAFSCSLEQSYIVWNFSVNSSYFVVCRRDNFQNRSSENVMAKMRV